MGINSPGGFIGAEVEYSPVRWFALGGGLGPTIQSNGETGAEVGAWITPRVAFDNSAIGVDVGTSGGPYATRAFMDEHGSWSRYDLALWFNTAVRYQYISDAGFSFGAFLGAATLLNPSAGSCGDGSIDEPCRSVTLGYAGVAFGSVVWRRTD